MWEADCASASLLSACSARRTIHALLRLRASYAVVYKAEFRHLGRAIDVAQVDQHRLLHHRFDAVEIERAELLPLGDDHQRIGALGARVRTVGECDAGKLGL